MKAKNNPWKIKNSKIVYETPWISVNHKEVINPGGKDSIYGVVHFKSIAVGVIPLDEDFNTWIVGQYRLPIDEYSWEIPEGGGALDVAPIESAKRELLEETGITAKKWKKILTIHTSNSATDESGIIYVAKDLDFQSAQPDDDEDLVIKKIPFKALFDMVMQGEVTDSLSIAAVLKVQHLIDAGEI